MQGSFIPSSVVFHTLQHIIYDLDDPMLCTVCSGLGGYSFECQWNQFRDLS